MLMDQHQVLQTKWNPSLFIMYNIGGGLGSLGRRSPIGKQSQTVNFPKEEDTVASLCIH